MQMNQQGERRIERTSPLKASLGDRIGAGVISLICLAVLTIAAWLNPASEGHGTHTQLGLSPCMWVVALDRPCPTCGMTTSFTQAGEGSWFVSLKTQPMGTLLVIMTTVVFWGSTVQAVSGARINSSIQPALKPRFFLVLGIMLLLAWFYKIATWQ